MLRYSKVGNEGLLKSSVIEEFLIITAIIGKHDEIYRPEIDYRIK
jgi:hypothetical protein